MVVIVEGLTHGRIGVGHVQMLTGLSHRTVDSRGLHQFFRVTEVIRVQRIEALVSSVWGRHLYLLLTLYSLWWVSSCERYARHCRCR
jgi:hypothetical protein